MRQLRRAADGPVLRAVLSAYPGSDVSAVVVVPAALESSREFVVAEFLRRTYGSVAKLIIVGAAYVIFLVTTLFATLIASALFA